MDGVKKRKLKTGEHKQILQQEFYKKEPIKVNHQYIKNINDIPDSILQYILSLLPIKDAVATSVLSKKWQYLWTCMPCLKFFLQGSTKEMNFVERVLLLHEISSIQSFTLIYNWKNLFRIYTWISALVTRHNVQRLSLNLPKTKQNFLVPQCFFRSKSLTCLELDMPCLLKLPSSVCFSSLKILHLSRVVFSDENSTYQLFSSPVLEKLSIKYCDWRNIKVVNVDASNLLSLIIHEPEYYNLTSYYDHPDPNRCEIKIFGNSLKSFEYCGQFFIIYRLLNFISVVEACISIPDQVKRLELVASPIKKFIGELYNVKDLKLSGKAFEALTLGRLEFLQMFNKLANLKIDSGPMNCDSKGMLKILHNSPHLETFEFIKGIGLSSGINEDRILDPVPPCFFSKLKKIKIGQFAATWEELYVVKSLFDRAEVLEKMVICGSLAMQSKISELLSDYPRKSRSCELIFI